MRLDKEALIMGSITGVISTVLVIYLLDPLFSLIGRIVSYIGQGFAQEYLNRLYKGAAEGGLDYAHLIVITLPLIAAISATNNTFRRNKTLNSITRKVKGNLLEERKERLKPTPESILKKVRRIKITLWASLTTVILLSALLIISTTLERDIIKTYNTQMKIIRPHIAEQEHKELEAMFASTKTYSDYLQFRGRLDNIVKEKSLVLPKNILEQL